MLWPATIKLPKNQSMQRYFFNLHECGSVTLDEKGIEFLAVAQAHDYALRQARAIMCAEVQEGRLCLGCNIEVRDAEGRLAVNVPFKDALTLSGL